MDNTKDESLKQTPTCENLETWLDFRKPLGEGAFGMAASVCLRNKILEQVFSKFGASDPEKAGADMDCAFPLVAKVSRNLLPGKDAPQPILMGIEENFMNFMKDSRHNFDNEIAALKYLRTALMDGRLERGSVPMYYSNFECTSKTKPGFVNGYVLESTGAPLPDNIANALMWSEKNPRALFYDREVSLCPEQFLQVRAFIKLAKVVEALEALRVNHNDLHFGNVALRQEYDAERPNDFEFMIIDFGMASGGDRDQLQRSKAWHDHDASIQRKIALLPRFRLGADMLAQVHMLDNQPLRMYLMKDTLASDLSYSDLLVAPEKITREFAATIVIKKLEKYLQMLEERKKDPSSKCYDSENKVVVRPWSSKSKTSRKSTRKSERRSSRK
jgi:hypothetical protein